MDYAELKPDPWQKAKDWVVYPDATATELWALDCPLENVGALTAVLASAGSAQYVSVDASEVPTTLEAAAILLAAGEAKEAAFSLEAGKVLYQVTLGRIAEGGLCVGLSFWRDQAFSKHVTASVHREVFIAMVRLGLKLCEAGQARALVLAPETEGDPRKLLDPNAPGQILWRRTP